MKKQMKKTNEKTKNEIITYQFIFNRDSEFL